MDKNFTVDFANQDCLKSSGKSCRKNASRDFLICEQKNPPILVGCDLNTSSFNVTIDSRILRVPKYSFVSDENQCMLPNMAENQENTELGQTLSLALKRKLKYFCIKEITDISIIRDFSNETLRLWDTSVMGHFTYGTLQKRVNLVTGQFVKGRFRKRDILLVL